MTHLSNARIRHYMTSAPDTIEEHESLDEARRMMFRLGARHLPVLHGDGLAGVISQRDIATIESLPFGRKLSELEVKDAMTPNPFTCGPDAMLHAVATEMAEHRYGSAVVVDRIHPAKVLGVFTTTDALSALAEIATPSGRTVMAS
jgi:acetoin utilization protein AcuB